MTCLLSMTWHDPNYKWSSYKTQRLCLFVCNMSHVVPEAHGVRKHGPPATHSARLCLFVCNMSHAGLRRMGSERTAHLQPPSAGLGLVCECYMSHAVPEVHFRPFAWVCLHVQACPWVASRKPI